MEERKLNIYEKLQLCRVELQQMKLQKGGKNKFAGFEYYELADFIPAVNQLFLSHKLHSVFNIEEKCELGSNNGLVQQIATLKIINVENPEEVEVFTSPTAEANLKGCTPIQSLGGVHTYMKRYLYLNALEIVEPDLLDTTIGKPEEQPQPKPQSKPQPKKESKPVSKSVETPTATPITPEQLKIILKQDIELQQYALQKFKVGRLDDMTLDQANYMIESLRTKGALKE